LRSSSVSIMSAQSLSVRLDRLRATYTCACADQSPCADRPLRGKRPTVSEALASHATLCHQFRQSRARESVSSGTQDSSRRGRGEHGPVWLPMSHDATMQQACTHRASVPLALSCQPAILTEYP
jgi:hypothetical protein